MNQDAITADLGTITAGKLQSADGNTELTQCQTIIGIIAIVAVLVMTFIAGWQSGLIADSLIRSRGLSW